tara:strand:- start:483 stop:713 length:231 start_codon:yes stop_codon:yes gene_type:complete
MKKTETEAIEILLKNIINMHEKLNILIDYLAKDIDVDKYQLQGYKEEDKLVEIEKDTYQQMCEMIGAGTIPFMGIA